MNRKAGIILFVLLFFMQLVLNRYMNVLKLNLDLLYLILVYIAVKSGHVKTMFTATAIGLLTDYFCMNNLGVFGFSRTLAAFFLHETAPHIDLKNNTFVFLFITISLSISNAIANIFFYFIENIPVNFNMLIYQPILTGLVGILILLAARKKRYLDVY